MANSRGLLVTFFCLAALQLFFMELAHCDWQDDFPGFEVTSTQNPERIPELSASEEESVPELSASEEESVPQLSAREREGVPELAAGGGKYIVVSKTTGQGDFTTIQAAINSIPAVNQQPVTIRINPGFYREKVQIPQGKSFITLVGSGSQSTVISWDDCSDTSGGTFNTATLSVFATDFVAKYITIENTHGKGNNPRGQNQAAAVRVAADRVAFYDSRMTGFQDTVLDEIGRHYFYNCYIEGAVDFICGNGQSIYRNCELHSLPEFYGVFTAQKRMSEEEDTGFVFYNCKLTGNGTNYLGQPWGPYSTVLFANTYMENIIHPAGWKDWDSDYYKEK
eukprot:PITA_03895